MISSSNTTKLTSVNQLRLFCKTIKTFIWEVLPANCLGDDLYNYNDLNGITYFHCWEEDSGFVIVFDENKVLIRGFSGESAMNPKDDMQIHLELSWLKLVEYNLAITHPYPGVIDSLPVEYRNLFCSSFLGPSEELYKGVTFCLWRSLDDSEWCTGDIQYPNSSDPKEDPDGSKILSIFETDLLELKKELEFYYETTIEESFIQKYFRDRGLENIVTRYI